MMQTEQKSDRIDEDRTGACRLESTTSSILEAKFGILLAQLSSTTDPSLRLALLEKIRQIKEKLNLEARKPHT